MKAVITSMLKEHHAKAFLSAGFEVLGGEEELVLCGSTLRSRGGISKSASCYRCTGPAVQSAQVRCSGYTV